jgi:hypothetical protein
VHKTKNGSATAGPTTADAVGPKLARLELNAEEIAALKKQGYIDSRRRGGRVYSRLRFRREETLHAIYIGCDAQRVVDIKAELEQLQSSHHQRHELKRAVRQGKTTLQAVKRRLRPTMCLLGVHFHGNTLRKSRARK